SLKELPVVLSRVSALPFVRKAAVTYSDEDLHLTEMGASEDETLDTSSLNHLEAITSGRPGKTTQATTARAVRRARRGDDFCLSALVAFSFEKIIMETRERGEREGREEEGREGTLSEGGGNMEGKGKTKEGESGMMDEKGRGTKVNQGEEGHRERREWREDATADL
ncbi:hypothetical protein PROFUN_16873, partial [Planoprotostelium fungivorum]